VKVLLGHNSTYYPSQGGGDKSNRLLMEALAERGHAVRVVTRTEHFGDAHHAPFEEALRERGVAHIDGRFTLNGVAVHTLTRDPNLRGYFARQIAEFDPDVIVVSTDDPGQLLLEAALEAPRARVVYLVRATIALPFGPDSSAQSAARTARLRGVDCIVGVSEYVARYVREFGGMDALHVPISLMEPGAAEKLGNFENPYVVMINPCAVKGIDIFLGLADAMPGVRFATVPSWGTTESDLAELRARGNIALLDRVDDIDDILRLTKVLLVPSVWAEARARVVPEAMSRAVPVIASNIGGLPEAKMGVDYLVPVRPVERYEPTLNSKMVPVAAVPKQDIGPWREALTALVTDRALYEDNARRSREAALAYLDNLNVLPFEALLERTERKARAAAPKKLSPDKQKLLALIMKQRAWFPGCAPSEMAARLICFPYAGAGTLWCRGWNACAALLPGRESRAGEAPVASMEALVAELEEAILPLADKPFTFFGHSMGAGIAFELTHALLRRGRRLPTALIVSSATAPALRRALPEPSDGELLAQLERLGGAPTGAANNPDWMKLVFPALRADTRLYRTYRAPARGPLPVPIYAYCGDSDPNLKPADMEAWRNETSAEFQLRVFPGGHFYFQAGVTALLSSISSDSGSVIR
jgi:surfactin synthase thioesterase subunit/glycosyltransferase involved in cell wall biosynthesis